MIVVQAREEVEEGRMRAIVVDEEEDAPDVSAGVGAEDDGDTVDSFVSDNAEDTPLGHDVKS